MAERLAWERITYHLVSKHEYGLEWELALAVVKQVFETGAQQVDDHHIVVAFHAKPVYIRNTN